MEEKQIIVQGQMKKQLLNSQVGRINVGGVLIIEVGLVVAIIVIVLVILNFNNMLSLSSIFSAKDKSVTQNKNSNPLENQPVKITGINSSKLYNFEITNQEELETILNDWGLFNKTIRDRSAQTGTIRDLTIELTDVEQAENKIIGPQGKTLLSSGLKIEPENKGELLIYVAPSGTSNPPEILDSSVEYQILSMLYKISHPVSISQESTLREAQLKDAVKKIKDSNVDLFSTSKK